MSEAVAGLAAEIIAALGEAAGMAAEGSVSLVSVTLDSLSDGEARPLRFETGVDRKTRTLVFLNARAYRGDDMVMTATAVYAISR